jgi:O-antigen/teichoic acid export membrane protein
VSDGGAATEASRALLDPRRLRRNVLLNGAAWVLPAVVAILAVPALAGALRADRFGLLALGWSAVAWFGVMDLGMGRALTFAVAHGAARARSEDVPAQVWTAGWLVWLVFGAAGLAGVLLAPLIATRVLDVPAALHAETVGVVRLLSVALPVVVHGILLRGVFEGVQQFGVVNALRLPLNLVTWGGPWLAVRWSDDPRVLVGIIVGARALYWAAHLPLLGRAVPGGARPHRPTRAAARALLHVGGWMTVSGVLSPILVHADRIILPAVVTIATVGWYVAAGDGAMRLWLFTAALQPVLFSAITASAATGGRELGALVRRATVATGAVLLPPALVLAWWSAPVLRWWLDAAWVPEASVVFRVILVAVYVNAFAQVAYTLLQGAGESRAVARVHLWEVPVMLVLLPVAVLEAGAFGAAGVWAARMLLDTGLLWWRALRVVPDARAAAPALVAGGVLGGAVLVAVSLLAPLW